MKENFDHVNHKKLMENNLRVTFHEPWRFEKTSWKC